MASSPLIFRLPLDVVPKHYDLDIITYLEPENFSFQGSVRIEIECLKPTDVIKIHARDLSFSDDKVSLKSTVGGECYKSIAVIKTDSDLENEFYIVQTGEKLVPGQNYSLHLMFHGILKEQLVGYYRSSYFDQSTKSTKYLSVTHFEPSDARQAFPCFDEVGMKATFTIRLAHKDQYNSISNMPQKSVTPFEGKPGWVWTEFEKTVPMSTYIIAYMVSEFEYRESEPQPNNVTFRVWARRDAIDQTDFSAKVGPQFLAFYEDFFNVKYPLPKQDLLAVPDFKIGAMENWGIVTFREAFLLLDEKSTSSSTKLGIANIIAHEISHMWFGNLVTMKWWTDLWLKEGFAMYMASISVHHQFPEWNSLDASFLSDLLSVFELDSLVSSHPISVPIEHPREISQIFDAISYNKGTFLLRMMCLFLGEEVFRHGLSDYLKKHQFRNAEQDDLWESLSEQAHRYHSLPSELNIKEVMDTWTLQSGYPLITFNRNYENNKATVSQRRFLAVESDNDDHYKSRWWIPISYSTSKDPQFNRTQPQCWFSKDKHSIEIDVKAGKGEWVVLNNKAAALIRVNYDVENWELLANTLNSPQYQVIDVINRAQLIIDSMDFAAKGELDYQLALRIVGYLNREEELVPWNAGFAKLQPIQTRLSRTATYGIFKKFMQSLMRPAIKSLGDLTEEPKTLERGRFLYSMTMFALSLGVNECATHALHLFNQWRSTSNPDNDNPIPKDVRRAIYSFAVQEGGEEVWNFLWKRYKNTNLSTEKNNILLALTATKEVWLISRYLDWTLDEKSGILKQDAFIIFKEVASKDIGFYVAQKFFFHNIKRISTYYGAKSGLIGSYFSALSDHSIYSYELQELKNFAELNKELLAPASLTVSQTLESIQINIHWMDNHYSAITNVLEELTKK